MIDKKTAYTVKNNTEADLGVAREIIKDKLGDSFSLGADVYPHNIGVQGDEAVFGETIVVEGFDSMSPKERQAWWSKNVVLDRDVTADEKGNTVHQGDPLGEASSQLTNTMPATTKILFAIATRS